MKIVNYKDVLLVVMANEMVQNVAEKTVTFVCLIPSGAPEL
ncbi:hypothetical protein [Desulfobacula sp.]